MGLKKMLRRQLKLCKESYGVDPRELEGEERANYMMRCVFALEHELHEMADTIRWKPWTSYSRGDWIDNFGRRDFVDELVDAQHFILQLLLIAGKDMSADDLAEEFENRWHDKAKVNAKRQKESYNGHGNYVSELVDPQQFKRRIQKLLNTPVKFCEHGNREKRCMLPSCLEKAVVQKTYGQLRKPMP